MKVAIKISSTQDANQFRGIGFYTKNLVDNLKKLENNNFHLITFTDRTPNADLYHFPDFNPFFLSFSPSLINQSIITIHDLIPIEFPKYYPVGIKGTLRWKIQKQMLKNVGAVITDSDYSKTVIAKILNLNKDLITPIHLAPANTSTSPKKPTQILPDSYVLYVGDFNWNKNIMLLAQACLELQTPLVVVGKQALNKDIDRAHSWNQSLIEFQDFAQKNSDIITLLGFVSADELSYLYQNAFCYVCSSIAEGFGLPVLEALYNRCPVISSNTTSLPEAGGQACLYFNPNHKEELISQIKKLKRQKNLRRILIKAGVLQSQKFSWQKTAQATLQVYQDLYEKI